MAQIPGTIGNDTLLGTDLADNIIGLTGDDLVYAGSGDDFIQVGPVNPVDGFTDNNRVYGEAGNDWIDGGYGNDTIYGGGDEDYLDGRDGDDWLDGGDDSDDIYGGYGNDTLLGGNGNDYLEAGMGDDWVYGGDGNDEIHGGPFTGNNDGGNDVLIGGTGDDRYIVDSASDVIIEYASEGIDNVDSSVSYTLAANVENLYLFSYDAVIDGRGNALDNIIVGTAGNNSLYGLDGRDQLYAGSGNDKLDGGNGNDTLGGGLGNDTLIGGSGYDFAIYNGAYTTYNASFTSNGDVQIASSEGTDLLKGIEQINFANGWYKVYTGDGGNNTLNADFFSTSLLYGGGGNDTFTGSYGNDTIAGSSGYDTAIYNTGIISDYHVSFTSNGDVQVYGKEGTDLLSGIEQINFANGGYYKVYTGDGGNNPLTATTPNVWSMLYGGGGNDSLTGNNGNDTLMGGLGNDTLVGGLGADKFIFSSKLEGIDIIKDFNFTEGDKIEISASFGATSLNQFRYNSNTGALSFDASPSDNVAAVQLATLENKPAGFSTQLDIILV